MVDDWNSKGKKGNSCPLLQLTMTAIQSHQVDTSVPYRSGYSHFVADCKFHHSGSSACGMVLPGCTSCSAGTFHNYITKINPSEPAFLWKLHQTLSLSWSPKHPLLRRHKLHYNVCKTLPVQPNLIHMKPVLFLPHPISCRLILIISLWKDKPYYCKSSVRETLKVSLRTGYMVVSFVYHHSASILCQYVAKQLTCHEPTQEGTVHRVRCQNKYQTLSFLIVPAYVDCE